MLTEALDHTILMHKEAHFGGSFDEMIAYYLDEDHLGIWPEIEVERIAYLQRVEVATNQNLTATLLTEEELDKVERAKKAYLDFKKLYEMENSSPFPKLIADLILSEYEEADNELSEVILHGEKILPDLLALLKWEEGYDPLFPGYGYAPYFAVKALEAIKDERAIIPLFELIGKEVVFDEGAILAALYSIGEPAKHFLLKTLLARPITSDNVNSALALSYFSDKEVEKVALYELENPEVWKHPIFFTYLLTLVEENKEKLKALEKDPLLPLLLKKEIAQLLM